MKVPYRDNTGGQDRKAAEAALITPTIQTTQMSLKQLGLLGLLNKIPSTQQPITINQSINQ